jgi:hypothetical protein
VKPIALLSIAAALLFLATPSQALENAKQTQKQIFVSPQAAECKAHPDECRSSGGNCRDVCVRWSHVNPRYGCTLWTKVCN